MATKNERDDLKDLHLMLIVLGVVLCTMVGFCAGQTAGKKKRQKEIENNALNINLTTEQNKVVETIIFGEIQSE